MSDFPYEVGDSFDGGPIELNQYISQILAAGGTFEYIGDTVVITELPAVEPEVKADTEPEPKSDKPEVKADAEPEPKFDKPEVKADAESEFVKKAGRPRKES